MSSIHICAIKVIVALVVALLLLALLLVAVAAEEDLLAGVEGALEPCRGRL